MRLVVCLLVFLALTAEGPRDFAGKWQTVMAYAYPFVDRIRSLPVGPWDVAVGLAGLLALLQRGAWRGRARVLDLALVASMGGLLAATAWGAMHGGDMRQAFYQLLQLMQMFLMTFVFSAVFRSSQDFLLLGQAVLAAALYRAAMCITFYVLFLMNESIPYPESITGHDDSFLWTMALLGLAAWVLTSPTPKALLVSAPLGVLMLLAVHFNHRRLAWVALVGGLAMIYLAMPMRSLSRRVKLWALAMLPVIVGYVALGWVSTNPAFAPIHKVKSALTGEDESSISRDIENTGLVVTLRMNLLLGSGFGHEYVEVSNVFSEVLASIFEQYRFIPHNALLGLVAFTGVLVFPVIWTALPIGAFLAARASLYARTPRDRLLAIVAFASPFVYSVAAYGDMGVQSRVANVLLAAGFAASGRLAVNTGAWTQKRRSRRGWRPAPSVYSLPDAPAEAPAPDAPAPEGPAQEERDRR